MERKDLAKCAYCGKIPTIIRLPGDLFYAQCTCAKQGVYDYLGTTYNHCVDVWNKGQYSFSQYKKGGKDEIC